jgi:hypothetical protein
MSTKKNSSPTLSLHSFRAALLVIGLLGAFAAAAQSPTSCATTAGTGGAFPLDLDTSVTSAKASDEWNSDVIRISIQEPGLLLVSAEGPEVQGLIYANGTTGADPVLLDEKGIGSAGRILALTVDPGDYCVQIAPPGGTTGAVRVRADLVGLTAGNPQ